MKINWFNIIILYIVLTIINGIMLQAGVPYPIVFIFCLGMWLCSKQLGLPVTSEKSDDKDV